MEVIERRKQIWGSQWLILGDMNDITFEKWGGKIRPEFNFKDFKTFISNNDLIDTGFEGTPKEGEKN